ncbi:DUF1707 SHOCT-like domain-containing protein [Actinopolymorpha alba]|uniref:DUF1707 SHOCT-like domain-containing protein n=1 Tax=Actinopolymorpha alba TaxID=533267 RepID=UPI00036423BA|nr:DUF1707 domain-containing protein [Actinopolymorpha alba]
MTTQHPIRASDAERDAFARRIQSAAAEGRLTLEEADERLGGVYASRFRHDLDPLVADLPADQGVPERLAPDAASRVDAPSPATPARPAAFPTNNRALAIHAVVVTLLSVMLVERWVISGVPYFWPMFPMFWLGLSLFVHAILRRRNDMARWSRG